jgi:tagaturonate reductase
MSTSAESLRPCALIATLPLAQLSGHKTVGNTLNDAALGQYINDLIVHELARAQSSAPDERVTLANSALDALRTEDAKIKWQKLAANPTTQWQEQVLPTLLESKNVAGKYPPRLVLSFAALVAHSRGKFGKVKLNCKDRAPINTLYAEAWQEYDESPDSVRELLSIVFEETSVWGQDLNMLPGLHRAVSAQLIDLLGLGVAETLRWTQV